MAQLSDDCFAFGGSLLTVDEAIALIRERVTPVSGTETVPLAAADGRVLACPILAPIPLPPFDNSAVDGYAVRFAELSQTGETVLPVTGRRAAGRAGEGTAVSGAVRIFTGAPMPEGFDTVFMQEDVTLESGGVRLPPGLKAGANRRLAGEDCPAGALALAEGRRLSPNEIALLAGLGLAKIPVRAPLKVALFSTGDELAAPGRPLGSGQLYDANRFMLAALLRRAGAAVSDLGILPDRRQAVTEALAAAAATHHLLLTSGGVSTGEEDHVRAAVEAAGRLTFWRVAIKPGRPVALGVIGGTPFIGLPGNPAAAYVTFVHLGRALLARLAGEAYRPPHRFPVQAGFAYRKKGGRREYVRARLAPEEDGLVARKHPREGAGVITSLTETDGLVELAEERLSVEPGAAVPFLPYALLA
jgi:molybdopterin molybdotransferase